MIFRKPVETLVVVLAFVVGTGWYLTHTIVWSQDSFGYFLNAQAILGMGSGELFYFRPPLMPLLMAITGVPAFDVVWPFTVTQLIMGVLMVWLFYRTLVLVSVNTYLSALGAIVFLVSFAPFVYSKAFLSEHTFLFSLVITLFGSVRYLRTPSWNSALIVSVGLICMTLARAQGTFLVLFVIPLLVVARWRNWRYMVFAAIVFGVYVGGYATIRSTIGFRSHAALNLKNSGAPSLTDMTGRLLIFVSYLNQGMKSTEKKAIVRPENGPSSERMFELLESYFRKPESFEKHKHPKFFDPYRDDPAGLVRNIAANPNGSYYYMIWVALDEMIGPTEADTLLLNVHLETAKTYPKQLARIYLTNLAISMFSPHPGYPYVPRVSSWPLGPERYIGELRSSGRSDVLSDFDIGLDTWFRLLHKALLVLVAISTLFFLRSRKRVSWIVAVGTIGYLYLTVMVANYADIRYTYYTVVPLILATMIGFDGLREGIRRSSAIQDTPRGESAEGNGFEGPNDDNAREDSKN